ncbi:hypothetical protein LINPERHAP2_LOCUS35415, partial [Linum perenne]
MDMNQTVDLGNLIAPKWNGRLQKERALHYILSYLDTKSSVQTCIV